jgi:VCBS repeat-containing protein
MTNSSSLRLVAFLAVLAGAWPAQAGQLVTASLKNGDYGTGTAVAPTSGVVNTPAGVAFIPTEVSGRSNALINWQIGNNPQFRMTGTITFLFKATRGQFANGEILCDNYGFGQFHNGQATFGASASHAAHGPGPEDDRVVIAWKSWHAGVWYGHSSTEIEYDRWYSLGFAWGGPFEFEIWVNQVRKTAVNIAASFPWGGASPPSGFNMGLGDNHERGVDAYNSAVGVMFADIRMWNEYRALGDTVDPNHAPTTEDDAFTIAEDDLLSSSAPGVLGNDSDQDGTALTAALVTDASDGQLTLQDDGSFTYQPDAGFHGVDSFTYSASDGEKSSEATVTITVTPVNDAPTANPDAGATNEDTPVTVNVAGNDTDPDGDPLTVTQASASTGDVQLDGNDLRYTPPADFSGPVTIGYTVSDGQGGTAQGVLSLDVTPVNDPPTTSNVAASSDGSPVTVTLTGTDIDSPALTFEAGAAVGGTVSGASPTFTFTPAAGFSGAGGFSFIVKDDHGATAAGVVTVNVELPPPPPPPDTIGALSDAIAGLAELNHGQRTSLLARLRNAQRALDHGHTAIAVRELQQVADALERFSSSAEAAAIAAALRLLAASIDVQ